MQVQVRPIGQLRHALPGRPRELTVDVPPGATVQDLVQLLGLSGDMIWYANVDGEAVPMGHTLADGAEVVFYAQMTGGD